MVVERLAQAIKEQASLFRAKTALEAEIEQHDAFARERIRFFTGRKELLQRISEHLESPGGRPILPHGESGSGKSALFAVASEIAAESEPRRIVIRRFIGATPSVIRMVAAYSGGLPPHGGNLPAADRIPMDLQRVGERASRRTARRAGRPAADDIH